jgi:hypothetical protein
MTFTMPLAFLAFLSLPLILILHLFRRRQRRVVVSHLGLWDFLRPEVRGPRARRIPLSWVLLLDLLAAAFFSLALTGPQLHLPEAGRGPRHVVVLLDVSTSMLAEDAEPNRFASAVAAAQDLFSDIPSNSVYSLITFSDEVRWVLDSRRDGQDDPAGLLEDLEAGFTGAALDQALSLAGAIREEALPLEIHILTDGAYPAPESDLAGMPILWHFFGQAADNRAVFDLAVSRLSGGEVQVFARLVNYGQAPAALDLTLADASGTLGLWPVSLPPGSAQPQVWTLQTPEGYLALALDGEDVLPVDDRAVIGLAAIGSVGVDLVADAFFPLDRAVAVLPQVRLTRIEPEDYVPGISGGLTIFRGFLPDSLPGGTALILPPPIPAIGNPDLTHLGYGGTVSIPANGITQMLQGEALLQAIDFSGVRWEKVRVLDSIPEGYEILLSVVDAEGVSRPILLRGREGNTRILLLLADLTAGNFSGHPAFPLLINQIVAGVDQVALPAALPLGSAIVLPAAAQLESLEIKFPTGGSTDRLTDWPETYTDTTAPGVYEFALELPDGRILSQVVGLNAGSPLESDLTPQAWSVEAREAAPPPPVEEDRLLDLSPWLLALGILVLLGEAVVAWR